MNQEKTLQFYFTQRYPNLHLNIIENSIKIWTSKSLLTPEKSIQNLIKRAKENEEVTLEYLTKKYPNLRLNIIETSIETCTLHSLAPTRGTIEMEHWIKAYNTVCISQNKLPKMYNTSNTLITLETFAQMALTLVEEKIFRTNTIIELLFLEHNKSAKKLDKESDLVKEILSLPVGVLKMTLKSVHTILLGITF
jgi:hypothetical protein